MANQSGSKPPKKNPSGQSSVGYGKPPASKKWKSGQSGNPSGRPKKPQSPHQVFLATCSKKATITIGGKPRKVAMLELVMRALLNKAANGDVEAIKTTIKLSEQSYIEVSKMEITKMQTEFAFSWSDELEQLFQQLSAQTITDDEDDFEN